ncbi:MAG: hypothetical protein AAFV37_03235 [Pseudomonadota bacterium]
MRYLAHLRDATIIMLATSVVLFEGFICVLMFMPIYYLIVSIGFGAEALYRKSEQDRRSKLKASILPMAIALLAIEGLSPSTSFERQNQVTRSVVVNASIDELKTNMAAEINLSARRHWFLSIFPLPVEIQAGTLNPGDVHKLDFIYKRWFFTNIDRGEFHLRIDEVSDDRIKTSVTRNTSYLAKYLNIQGTEVQFNPISENQTEIALTIHYERLLDPAWYFGPMQRFAVSQSADYLVDQVIVKEFQHVE